MTRWWGYALAIAGYIVLAWYTKHYVDWFFGPVYFVLALEALPRTYRLVRRHVVRQ